MQMHWRCGGEGLGEDANVVEVWGRGGGMQMRWKGDVEDVGDVGDANVVEVWCRGSGGCECGGCFAEGLGDTNTVEVVPKEWGMRMRWRWC